MSLPRYSSSISVHSVPIYSPEPSAGEQRLDHTVSRAAIGRTAPTGVLTRENERVSVVLTHQEDGAALPTYGRNDAVRGVLHLKGAKGVTSVAVKLDGIIDLTVAEGSTSYTPLMAQSVHVWQSNSPNRSASSNTAIRQCPDMIPFECMIPLTYQIGERTRPLPPSFQFCSPGIPGLYAKCKYILTVEISKKGFWKRKTTFSVPFVYYPHTRPHRPILPSHLTFMSTFKTSPEEWHQVIATMMTRPRSGYQPIQCHLFVPAAQIFAICDTIPFHVQLCAPLASLHALTRGPPPPQGKTKSLRRNSTVSLKGKEHVFIRVFLLRQIIVTVHGQRAWRTCVTGEGSLRPLPPPLVTQAGDEHTIDWEGEVKCGEGSVSSGGFNTGNLVVKDFIVLALYPPRPTSSPLFEMQHAHPIRIVTDPWTDMPGIPEATLTASV